MISSLTPLNVLARQRGEGLHPDLAKLVARPQTDADRYRFWDLASPQLMSGEAGAWMKEAAD